MHNRPHDRHSQPPTAAAPAPAPAQASPQPLGTVMITPLQVPRRRRRRHEQAAGATAAAHAAAGTPNDTPGSSGCRPPADQVHDHVLGYAQTAGRGLFAEDGDSVPEQG